MPEVVGVTLDWALRPARCWRFSDGKTGLVFRDRQLHPEAYGSDGWPIDPETGERLPIYEEGKK